MLLVAVPPWSVVPVFPLAVRLSAWVLASGGRAVRLILSGSATWAGSEMAMARWILVFAAVVLGLSLAGASLFLVRWLAARRSRGNPAGSGG
ncbi:MAG TPA: hypothetical protein VLZ77_13360 [Acidimicrobiales bacterium]|nr:hypothetical protein [Acidimicrobiales bacterium]